MKLVATCLFGLEGIVGEELKHLGIKNVEVGTGRVFFDGEAAELARANICLRCAERVMIVMGKFRATSFEELFENVKNLRWEDIIPSDGAFPVKGYSVKSKLYSVPDCQSIIKKAVVDRLSKAYHLNWMPETAETYQIRFSILSDEVTVCIDASGVGLHKRGYREIAAEAPIRETLAAAMVQIAGYRGFDILCDPMCGSGTILIEAAMLAKKRAPGMNRRYAAERWPAFAASVWREERNHAIDGEFHRQYRLWGGDIDPKVIEIAKSNAKKAGVDEFIEFVNADVNDFRPTDEFGMIITNPPYGDRLLEIDEAESLYGVLGRVTERLKGFSVNVITSDADFERCYGRRAEKKRKLYNGMKRCDFYIYPASKDVRKAKKI